MTLLVGVLSGIEMHDIAGQYLSLVATAEGSYLSDEVIGFLVRYEARRLDSVNEYLQLRQAEAAILYVIRILLAVLDLHYLIALCIEYFYVSCHRSAVCGVAKLGKTLEQGIGRNGMFGVGILLQYFQQLDNSQFLVGRFGHGFILLCL